MKEHKISFYNLLCSLLFILLIYPFSEGRPIASLIFALFFSWLLISSLWAISPRRTYKVCLLIFFGIPSVALLWLDRHFNSFGLRVGDYLFMSVIIGWTIASMLNYIMRAGKVTGEILAGAGSVYLLIGIFWGIVNSLLYLLHPGSFAISEALSGGMHSSWPVFNYYSFTTLTTIGYGDITPVTARAQSFAIIEASMGVLFIALLISRLVGMYISQNVTNASGE